MDEHPLIPSDEEQFVPRTIKAEVNLLRLPIFALSTRGLRDLDGLEIRGRRNIKGHEQTFTFRVSRNTLDPYPGPLARAAHQAFLSILTEQGFPAANPVTWTWRDLCRRIGIEGSGRSISQLQTAIESTKSLTIHSNAALYSKTKGKPISTRRTAFNLYDHTIFIGDEYPDGTKADHNAVQLSQWYLDSLNALYTAPLDYELWKALDRESYIASRLYEFLTVNFYAGIPRFRMNYLNLAQMLPIRPERYYSDAQRQLQKPLKLITEAGIIHGSNWRKHKTGIAQLTLGRGDRLATHSTRPANLPVEMAQDFNADLTVKELRNMARPEARLAQSFYTLWRTNQAHRLTAKDLTTARDFIDLYGKTQAEKLLPVAVARMRDGFPKAQSIGALRNYMAEAAAAREARKRQDKAAASAARERHEQAEQSAAAREARTQHNATWQPRWDAAPETTREAIRQHVIDHEFNYLNTAEPSFAKFILKSPTFHDACLDELARRKKTPAKPR